MLRRLTFIDIVLALFAVTLVLRFPFDPDMWWHMKVGQDLLAGIFPYRDIYTWSMPAYPWVDHEWLTDAAMYLIQHVAGLVGLGLVFICITIAAYLLATRTGVMMQRHASPESALPNSVTWRLGLALIVVALVINEPVLGTRPQMISLLGFAVVNYCVWQYLTGERKSLWVLIPLFWLWANLHGGFTLGLLLVGLTWVTLIGAYLIRPLRGAFPFCLPVAGDYGARIVHMGLALAGSVVAGLANPYTYRVYEEALRTGTDSLARSVIGEWKAVDFQGVQGLLIGAFVFLFLWWLVWSRRNHSAWHLLIMPVFVYLGLSSVRHSAPMVIFMLPWVYASLADVPLVQRLAGKEAARWLGIRRAPWFHYAYNVFILLFPLGVLMWQAPQFVTYSTDLAQLTDRFRYPRAAVDYLKTYAGSNDLIFNDYNWGGYLIWNLPEHKVYIDGRMPSWQTADVHILQNYERIANLSPDWMDLLRASHATLVLTDSNSRLAAALSQAASFQRIYYDDIAVIYRSR